MDAFEGRFLLFFLGRPRPFFVPEMVWAFGDMTSDDGDEKTCDKKIALKRGIFFCKGWFSGIHPP